jgi:hypothetical protein
VKTQQKLITDQELEDVWGSANFGDIAKIDVIKVGLMKVASGYANGHTCDQILQELKLINQTHKLTKKGQFNLYHLWVSKEME